MALITKDFTFTNGAGNLIDATQVNANFDEIYALVNGALDAANLAASAKPATLLGAYRTIHEFNSGVLDSASGAGVLVSGNQGFASLTNHSAAFWTFLDDADYLVSGLTPKLRVRFAIQTNATAPGVTLTAGLYPITASAGAADTTQLTLGAVTAGSTVAFVTPAANSMSQSISGDFAFPGDGYYLIGVNCSGALTTNAFVSWHAQLQLHWI